ncbi:MAG: hypothetical protein KAH30_06735 [Caldisericia bacterium]|nr:hypothetical protein [Caldisericia bacterium]
MQIKNTLNGSVRRVSRLYRVIFVSLLCIILLTSSGLSNTKASGDQMAINLHVIVNSDGFTLKWDNVYSDYWYIPEKELDDDNFYPLVDIPIRENEFEYKGCYDYSCFRIRVVDKKYKEVAVSKEKVCVRPDDPFPPILYNVGKDGDCRCLLMMCYQVGTKHAYVCICVKRNITMVSEIESLLTKMGIFSGIQMVVGSAGHRS